MDTEECLLVGLSTCDWNPASVVGMVGHSWLSTGIKLTNKLSMLANTICCACPVVNNIVAICRKSWIECGGRVVLLLRYKLTGPCISDCCTRQEVALETDPRIHHSANCSVLSFAKRKGGATSFAGVDVH